MAFLNEDNKEIGQPMELLFLHIVVGIVFPLLL
jgi:hypothetical protein